MKQAILFGIAIFSSTLYMLYRYLRKNQESIGQTNSQENSESKLLNNQCNKSNNDFENVIDEENIITENIGEKMINENEAEYVNIVKNNGDAISNDLTNIIQTLENLNINNISFGQSSEFKTEDLRHELEERYDQKVVIAVESELIDVIVSDKQSETKKIEETVDQNEVPEVESEQVVVTNETSNKNEEPKVESEEKDVDIKLIEVVDENKESEVELEQNEIDTKQIEETGDENKESGVVCEQINVEKKQIEEAGDNIEESEVVYEQINVEKKQIEESEVVCEQNEVDTKQIHETTDENKESEVVCEQINVEKKQIEDYKVESEQIEETTDENKESEVVCEQNEVDTKQIQETTDENKESDVVCEQINVEKKQIEDYKVESEQIEVDTKQIEETTDENKESEKLCEQNDVDTKQIDETGDKTEESEVESEQKEVVNYEELETEQNLEVQIEAESLSEEVENNDFTESKQIVETLETENTIQLDGNKSNKDYLLDYTLSNIAQSESNSFNNNEKTSDSENIWSEMYSCKNENLEKSNYDRENIHDHHLNNLTDCVATSSAENILNNQNNDYPLSDESGDVRPDMEIPNNNSETELNGNVENSNEDKNNFQITEAESVINNDNNVEEQENNAIDVNNQMITYDHEKDVEIVTVMQNGVPVNYIYFESMFIEECMMDNSCVILRKIKVGMGGRIIGKKGRNKQDLKHKYNAELWIFESEVPDQQILKVICPQEHKKEVENKIDTILHQVRNNTVQTNISNPERLKPLIPLGKMVPVQIIEMYGVESLKVKIVDEETNRIYQEMTDQINSDYIKNNPNAKMPHPISVNCICIANIDNNKFARSMILEIFEDHSARVYLLDFGIYKVVHFSQIFKIKDKFMRLAYRVFPAKLSHAKINNLSRYNSNSIHSRFLTNDNSLSVVYGFFTHMLTCCVPHMHIYANFNNIKSRSQANSDNKFVDLVTLLNSLDIVEIVEEKIEGMHKDFNNQQVTNGSEQKAKTYYKPPSFKSFEKYVRFSLGYVNTS